jgi:PAS domain S-box-containing protein
VTSPDDALADSAEDLFENAPCGYLSTRLDGTILRVNETFVSWTGLARADLLGGRRLQDLLSPGGRIYYETHLAPLLLMQGSVREIAVEIVRADGTRLPALLNCALRSPDDAAADPDGRVIRTTVFDATDRRRYEQELVRMRRREQDIAQELQRSLLSGELPAADGLDLAVAYRPGVSGLEVGGDWYDAFWLDEGETVALVVGDVVGRGITAAATMGQLRSALRALAATGLGPARVVAALDGYSRRHGVGRMTTLVYARLQLASGRCDYACAGHVPPVVVSPGEPPALVWDGRSLPLDAHRAGARAREEGSLVLAPGGTLLLYTDGLVERRSRALDAGFEQLLAAVAAHRDDRAAALASALVHALRPSDQSDDVCLLVARLAAPAAV